jgi:nucleoside phosphorylase
VIAVLPDGQYGRASALATARDMLASFSNVRIGLMVGIGGGAPTVKNDIRLGDVVVSSPRNGMGGVFQYDFGKTVQDKAFRVTSVLDQPPQLLRTSVSGLRARYERRGHELSEAVDKALTTIKKNSKYKRPSPASDKLFSSTTIHLHDSEADCQVACDTTHLIQRNPRDEEEDDPVIHYGLIASADQLMKDAYIRDMLSADRGVLCFEMEAAGLVNHFPCLVVRGICDLPVITTSCTSLLRSIGETCGLKLIYETNQKFDTCQLCQDDEKKQRRYEKMYRDVQRWQREGNRNATIERTSGEMRDVLEQIHRIGEEHKDRLQSL